MSAKNQLQELIQKRGLPLPSYTYIRSGGEDHAPEWSCQMEYKVISSDSLSTSATSGIWSSKKKASEEAAKIALEYHFSGSDSPCPRNRGRDRGRDREKLVFGDKWGLGASFKAESPEIPKSKRTVVPRKEDNSSTFILLDLENAPNSYEELCQNVSLDETYTLFGFYSKNSHHIYKKVCEQYRTYQVPIYFYKAHSAHKDAADVRMTLFVGEILGIMRYSLHGGYAPLSTISAEDNGLIFLNIENCIIMKFIIITNDHFGEALGDLINNYYYNSVGEMEVKADVYHCVSEMIMV